jgi:hypothetical protein
MPQSFAEHLKAFPLSPNLGQSLERAHGFARDQSHRLVTLEHLLLALTEDPEAVIIMQAANVDLARLSTDVSAHLGRLMEDMRADGAVEPRPDPELLRVLQAAATAALQSKRRLIDGAIVLAAIVGDGKSPAAGMLKALGMTFEEAIRALQRANTKARLKPQTKPVAPGAASAPQPAATPAAAPAPAPTPIHVAQKLEPVLPAEEMSTQQTAEEILAAARERIRQRAAAAKAERAAAAAPQPAAAPAAPAATPAPPAEAEPAPAPESAADAATLAGAIKAAMTTTPAPEPPPATLAPADATEPQSRTNLAPPTQAQPPAVSRLPLRRTQGPPLPRPIQPNEGPPRPPLPLRPGQRPQAKFPPPRAPWPETADPARGPRLPPPNGSLPGAHHPPPMEGYGPPPSPWPATARPSQRAGQAERGPLVENVPRVMRAGRAVPVEVHIARDKIETLIAALSGRGASFRPDAFVTRAVSVRLRAPQGGFWIEADSPETQWAESTSAGAHDDYAVWRWTVLPHRRGRGRLLLTVSTRTVGHDGIASESAPPDRVIDVKVKSNKLRGLGKLLGWILVLSIGAVAGYFGQDGLDTALVAIKKLIASLS